MRRSTADSHLRVKHSWTDFMTSLLLFFFPYLWVLRAILLYPKPGSFSPFFFIVSLSSSSLSSSSSSCKQLCVSAHVWLQMYVRVLCTHSGLRKELFWIGLFVVEKVGVKIRTTRLKYAKLRSSSTQMGGKGLATLGHFLRCFLLWGQDNRCPLTSGFGQLCRRDLDRLAVHVLFLCMAWAEVLANVQEVGSLYNSRLALFLLQVYTYIQTQALRFAFAFTYFLALILRPWPLTTGEITTPMFSTTQRQVANKNARLTPKEHVEA